MLKLSFFGHNDSFSLNRNEVIEKKHKYNIVLMRSMEGIVNLFLQENGISAFLVLDQNKDSLHLCASTVILLQTSSDKEETDYIIG